LNQAYFLIPGDPDRRTGGTIYDRRIMAGLAALGWSVTLQRLDATFPGALTPHSPHRPKRRWPKRMMCCLGCQRRHW